MSSRSAFTTENIGCDECLRRVRAALAGMDRITLYPGDRSVAGIIRRIGDGSVLVDMELQVFPAGTGPCHTVRVAVIPDDNEARDAETFRWEPIEEVTKEVAK